MNALPRKETAVYKRFYAQLPVRGKPRDEQPVICTREEAQEWLDAGKARMTVAGTQCPYAWAPLMIFGCPLVTADREPFGHSSSSDMISVGKPDWMR